MAAEFKSQLGNVHITEERFGRKKKGDWENILQQYPEEKILDKASYADIEGLKLETGSIHPCIKAKIDSEWNYIFFQINDPVEKCWNRLRYMWQAWHQNH